MGRAIDMESDIQKLKVRVGTLEDIVRGMTHSIDEMSEKSTKTKHIDLVDDVKKEEKVDAKTEEKANDETSGNSDGKRNKKSRKSSSKSV